MKKSTSYIFTAWCLLPFLGCSSDSDNNPSALTPLPYSVVSEGYQDNIQIERHEVVNTSDEFIQLISSIPSMTGNIPDPDFSVDTLIATFSDAASVSCRASSVASITEDNRAIFIELDILQTTPLALCDSFSGNRRKHYLMIKLPKSSKEIVVNYIDKTANE